MPYIAREHRPKLDSLIEALADAVAAVAKETANDKGDATAYAGLLNYTLTRVTMLVVAQCCGPIRYATIATVSGVLKNVNDEFYRRVAAPYEDKQIAKNGDVPEYAP
jgi:hypothetical protein